MTASIDRDVPSPQLADYASACRSFDWDGAWEYLGDTSHPPRGVNIADVAVDRHVRAGRGDAVAMRWLGRDDAHVASPVEVTYEALALRTNRFASALQRRGFEPGGGLATLTGRVPELYVAALGALKAQMVFTPLFSAFGPDPIAQRVELAAAFSDEFVFVFLVSHVVFTVLVSGWLQ